MQDDRAEEAYYRDKPLHDEINRLKAELVSMRRALRAVPDGWKLVPIEPTEAMIEAGRYEDGRNTAMVVWEEMVAAAPEPKGEGK